MSCAFSISHTNQRKPVSMKAVQEILKAMKFNAEDPDALAASCAEIVALAGANPNNSAKIGPKGIDAILACMKKHPGHNELAGAACDALGALASGNFINKKRMGSLPVVKLVAEAMRAHLAEPKVLLRAMAALENITDSTPHNAAAAVRHGVEDLVWRAMTFAGEGITDPQERLEVQQQIQRKGGNLFGVLTATGENILDKIAAAIVASMEAAAPGDQLAQGNGCQVLQHLANSSKDAEGLASTREHIAQQGAVPLLLRTLDATAAEPDNDPLRVVAPALTTLKHLTWVSSPRQQLVAEAGGVAVVLKAMAAFEDAPAVQAEGCAVLRNLAWHPDVHAQLLEDNVLEPVLTALRAHPHDFHVQQAGLSAVWQIAGGEEGAVVESTGTEAVRNPDAAALVANAQHLAPYWSHQVRWLLQRS